MAGPPKRNVPPSQQHDVMRIEHDNLESTVQEHRDRLRRVETRIEELAREMAELVRVIAMLRR